MNVHTITPGLLVWVLAPLLLDCSAHRVAQDPLPARGSQSAPSWADLTPGMELKVDGAYYRGGPSRPSVENYLGDEAATYTVEPGGDLRLKSDSPLRANVQRPPDQPAVISLISARLRSGRYHRLLFQVVLGGAAGTRQAILLRAQSTRELDRLTEPLLQSSTLVCPPARCTAFPEWCTASLFISVTVNGELRVVSWGSTLANVAPRAKRVTLMRAAGENGKLTPVPVDTADADALRMPLNQGDRVVWE